MISGSQTERWEVMDLLTSLADKSLEVAQQEEGQTRYRLLETVRQYGHDRLAESHETESVKRAHRDTFLALAEEAMPSNPASMDSTA